MVRRVRLHRPPLPMAVIHPLFELNQWLGVRSRDGTGCRKGCCKREEAIFGVRRAETLAYFQATTDSSAGPIREGRGSDP